jgi:TetR/AcrR family transcriptional regulator, transcriptional repressor for nem operon
MGDEPSSKIMNLWDYKYNPNIMRYGPDHKYRTHQRIVKSASRQFRAHGLSGPGVARVMRASGLTVGGFYKHFRNRDDLVAEAVAESLRDMRERMLSSARQAPTGEAWKLFIRNYLSIEHCEHADIGCPIPALAPEISRTKASVKKRIAGMLKQHRDGIMPIVPGRGIAEKQRTFIVTLSAMAGAVALARTMTDLGDKQRILNTVRDYLLSSC